MKMEFKAEELRKYSLFIGTPMYGAQCTGVYSKAIADLTALCQHYGIKINTFFMFNESLIQRARNYIADAFLESGYTHLMFIDADIGFNPNDVIALLGIQISDPEKYNIITAPYPKKSIAWEKVQRAVELKITNNPFDLNYFTGDYVFNPIQNSTGFKLDEPVEISEAGTGFMLIPRNTFEKYSEAYPELKYLPDHLRSEKMDGSKEITAYFHCDIDPETRRYLSEDYFFCQKTRKLGMSVYMCPWMELQHIGNYTYRGSLSAIAALRMTPTADQKSNSKSYKKINKLGTRP